MTKRDTIGNGTNDREFPRNIMNKKMMICHDLLLASIVYYILVSTRVVSLNEARQGFSKGSTGSRAAVGAGHTPSRGRRRDKKWDSYRVKKKL